ncbi:hypothetical protein WDV06_16980, partial [Streptomyces racemochromogenes]
MLFLTLLVPPLLMCALLGLDRYEEYMLGPPGGPPPGAPSRPAPRPAGRPGAGVMPGRGGRRVAGRPPEEDPVLAGVNADYYT